MLPELRDALDPSSAVQNAGLGDGLIICVNRKLKERFLVGRCSCTVGPFARGHKLLASRTRLGSHCGAALCCRAVIFDGSYMKGFALCAAAPRARPGAERPIMEGPSVKRPIAKHSTVKLVGWVVMI